MLPVASNPGLAVKNCGAFTPLRVSATWNIDRRLGNRLIHLMAAPLQAIEPIVFLSTLIGRPPDWEIHPEKPAPLFPPTNLPYSRRPSINRRIFGLLLRELTYSMRRHRPSAGVQIAASSMMQIVTERCASAPRFRRPPSSSEPPGSGNSRRQIDCRRQKSRRNNTTSLEHGQHISKCGEKTPKWQWQH
jgi:hypothetical protein